MTTADATRRNGRIRPDHTDAGPTVISANAAIASIAAVTERATTSQPSFFEGKLPLRGLLSSMIVSSETVPDT
jgi:hypothetical protein